MGMEKIACAFHEGGHVVEAIHHNITFSFVTIVPDDSKRFAGYVKLDPVPLGFNHGATKDSPESLDFWHRRLIVIMAGEAAHKRIHPRANHFGYSLDDRHEAYQIIKDIHQSGDRVIEAHFKYIKALTEELVQKHWTEIEAVAHALLQRGVLSSYEVQEAIEAVCGANCIAGRKG
jgi:hypothetical protein